MHGNDASASLETIFRVQYSMPTILRYIAFQLPSWLIVAFIAVALDVWSELPRPLLVGAFALYLVKDFVIYPWVRSAYEHTEHDPGSNMLAARGVVIVSLDPVGWVRVGSERWRAETVDAAAPLAPGTAVEVSRVRGHTLLVVAVMDQEP
jgi:membrane protein implicated in regulation of membrane protease activity